MPGLVISKPKSIQELYPLVGKPVLLGNIMYGILAINEKTNQFLFLCPDYADEISDKYALELTGEEIFSEITKNNIIAFGIIDSFERLSTWYSRIDWDVLGEDWKHVSQEPPNYSSAWNDDGELIKNQYNKDSGFKFL